MASDRAYLGDGVYIDIDPWGCYVLTTEDGIRATNRIVLEPEVVAAFLAYHRKHYEFSPEGRLRKAELREQKLTFRTLLRQGYKKWKLRPLGGKHD
jgi:hypothetical protein